jgi:DNA transposition AAA+ family ATPase
MTSFHDFHGHPHGHDPEVSADLEAVDNRKELVTLARNIRAWQDRQKPRVSDEAMLRLYPGLGSTKTYKRLREGDYDGLVVENHLPKYHGVWNAIEAALGAAAAEEIYEDLTPAVETSLAVASLIPQRGKERLVLIEGPTGSGKTEALRIIARTYAGQTAMVEAHEGWQSLSCALGDILLALGYVRHRADLPPSTAGRLACCIDSLQRQRRLVLIDEAHHATAAVLNSVKTMLNQTESLFVLAGIDTLWRKLTARSWEEARQLVHNRLHERVRLAAPSAADARRFLCARVAALGADGMSKAFAHVAAASAHCGQFAYLRRLAERLNSLPAGEITAADVTEQAAQLKTTLETR